MQLLNIVLIKDRIINEVLRRCNTGFVVVSFFAGDGELITIGKVHARPIKLG